MLDAAKDLEMKYYKLQSATQRRKCNVIYTCTGERSRCQYRVSPFKNTFFDGHFSKIPLGKVLQVILLSICFPNILNLIVTYIYDILHPGLGQRSPNGY